MLIGNTLINSNEGMFPLELLSLTEPPYDTTENVNYTIESLDNTSYVYKFSNLGEQDTIRLITEYNYTIEGSKDHIIYTSNGQKHLDEIQLGDELLIKTSCNLYNNKDLLTEEDINIEANDTLEEKIFQSTKSLQIAFLKKYLSKYGYFDDNNLYRINDINNLQYLLLHFNILSDKFNNLLTVSDKTSYYELQQFLSNEKDLTMIKAIAPE